MSDEITETVNFEKSLAELEALVERMEAGDLPLEESLTLFERGIRLTRLCQTVLDSAEQKVQVLMTRNGEETVEDLDSDEPGSA